MSGTGESEPDTDDGEWNPTITFRRSPTERNPPGSSNGSNQPHPNDKGGHWWNWDEDAEPPESYPYEDEQIRGLDQLPPEHHPYVPEDVDWEKYVSYNCRWSACQDLCLNRADSPYAQAKVCRACYPELDLDDLPELTDHLPDWARGLDGDHTPATSEVEGEPARPAAQPERSLSRQPLLAERERSGVSSPDRGATANRAPHRLDWLEAPPCGATRKTERTPRTRRVRGLLTPSRTDQRVVTPRPIPPRNDGARIHGSHRSMALSPSVSPSQRRAGPLRGGRLDFPQWSPCPRNYTLPSLSRSMSLAEPLGHLGGLNLADRRNTPVLADLLEELDLLGYGPLIDGTLTERDIDRVRIAKFIASKPEGKPLTHVVSYAVKGVSPQSCERVDGSDPDCQFAYSLVNDLAEPDDPYVRKRESSG